MAPTEEFIGVSEQIGEGEDALFEALTKVLALYLHLLAQTAY